LTLDSPSLHAPIQAAFAANTPLPEINTKFQLSLDDLHKFLSTPGIPDNLQALRALTNFSEELQASQGRQEGTAYLRQFLQADHEPVEKRRAATALLRAGPPGPPSKSPDRQGGARSGRDISEWLQSPDIDDPEDAELDEPADADLNTPPGAAGPPSDGPGGASHRRLGASATSPRPAPLPPQDPSPDQLVAFQLALLQSLPSPTVPAAIHALDRTLSWPMRMHSVTMQAFREAFPPEALNLRDAQLTQDPAVLDTTSTPHTATIGVHAKHQDGTTAHLIFLLHHEDWQRHNAPPVWATRSITRADSS
jgi:hypothetical protein